MLNFLMRLIFIQFQSHMDMETVAEIGIEVATHTLASTYKRRMWFAKQVPEDFIQTNPSFCSFAKGSWRKRVF